MQIYGDNGYDITVASFANELLARIGDEQELASMRATLIGCGQLEQLTADAAGISRASLDFASRATDHAAAAFYAIWSRYNPHAPRRECRISREIEELRSCVAQLALSEEVVGRLKIPEGFAFYALYPEQYCAAAVAYLQQHTRTAGLTHVVGLRSIGTTLSAAVTAVLDAAEIQCRRYTVRPYGHPFDRQVALAERFGADDRVLVVDEGPGLSGSSFFSVGRALTANGVSAGRQVYLCAHSQPPGKMARPEISAFWEHAQRYVASSFECAFGPAGSLLENVELELEGRFDAPVRQVEDLSQGRWRALAAGESPERLPSYAAFERPKLLAELEDGRRVLLKFYGQVLRMDPVTCAVDWSDAAAARQIASGDARATRVHGYVARLWLDGELLTPAAKTPSLLERLALFLAERPWHCTRGSGNAADCCYAMTGSLAPQEWLRLPSGRVVKLPETLAGFDHTAIDSEPLGWDLAAALIEWQLSEGEAEQLLAFFRARSGIDIELRDVLPHAARYARFQLEKARFCANQAGPGEESRRLELEAVRYAAYENGTWR